MTDQEKSKIICDRVVIKPVNKRVLTRGLYRHYVRKKIYPNLFTPDGQVVLAKALTKHDNLDLWQEFDIWMRREEHPYKYKYNPVDIIADTKLAELFYEFIEGEKNAQHTSR